MIRFSAAIEAEMRAANAGKASSGIESRGFRLVSAEPNDFGSYLGSETELKNPSRQMIVVRGTAAAAHEFEDAFAEAASSASTQELPLLGEKFELHRVLVPGARV